MGRRMNRLVLDLAIVACALAVVSAADAAKSPQALYTALLTTPWPDSQLPSDFFSAKVSLSHPTKQGAKYHEIGEVDVEVDGPDPDDAASFYVFPTAALARGDMAHPNLGTLNNARVMGRVPGYGANSQWIIGSITGKNAFGKTITNGVTGVFVVKGNVIVGAITDSASNDSSGDMPNALALLRAALRHLVAVGARG
jgi:hypothetical protein